MEDALNVDNPTGPAVEKVEMLVGHTCDQREYRFAS